MSVPNHNQSHSVHIFYRTGNFRAKTWSERIITWLRKKYPKTFFDAKKPEIVLALGGDGTILQAAKQFYGRDTLIFGMNLGDIGFLASVRKEKDFLPALNKVFSGKFNKINRIAAIARVIRAGKPVFERLVINEAAVQNPLGMVDVDVIIDGHKVQSIRGTGALVATPTGSTAMNLSAHGPILVPELNCLVVTELLDHDIPTPNIVLTGDSRVDLFVRHFRARNLLRVAGVKKPADVLLSVDGESPFPLERGDIVSVCRADTPITLIETERHYFYKSLQEKFGLN